MHEINEDFISMHKIPRIYSVIRYQLEYEYMNANEDRIFHSFDLYIFKIQN